MTDNTGFLKAVSVNGNVAPSSGGKRDRRVKKIFSFLDMCITVYCVFKIYNFHSLIRVNEMR